MLTSSRSGTASSGIGGLTFDSFSDSSPVICIENDPTGASNLVFTWQNQPGMLYDIRSNTDLSIPPSTWDIFEGDIEADASGTNVLTVPHPIDETTFFVLEERSS